MLELDKAASSCRGLTRDIIMQPAAVDWKRLQIACNRTQATTCLPFLAELEGLLLETSARATHPGKGVGAP